MPIPVQHHDFSMRLPVANAFAPEMLQPHPTQHHGPIQFGRHDSLGMRSRGELLRASCGRLREATSKDNVAVRLLRFFHHDHHITPPSFLSIFKTNTPTFIKMQNEHGQGISHATDSKVPSKIQEQAPSKLEHELPDVSLLFHPGWL
jgi:hypothetical protein